MDDSEILDFINKQIRNGSGALELSMTEHGNIGVFISGLKGAQGTGDTFREAMMDFVRSHESPHELPVTQ